MKPCRRTTSWSSLAVTVSLLSVATAAGAEPAPAPAPAAPGDPAAPSGATTAADPTPATPTPSDDWFTSLDLSAHAGAGVRLDDPPLLAAQSRAGLLFGLGFDLFLSESISLGLHYEHLDLGEEGGALWQTGTIQVIRDLNGLWLRLRAYPWRGDEVGVYLAVAAGPSWQSVEASGAAWLATQPGVGAEFACEGAGSADVALRGALGVDGAPAPPLRLWASLGFDTYRLGDDAVGSCAPGAGTAAVLGLRAGLAYGIPLGD